MFSEILFNRGVEKAKIDLDLMSIKECYDHFNDHISSLRNDFSNGYLLTIMSDDKIKAGFVMCNPEWEKGVELAVNKVAQLGFDDALGWGSMNLNTDVDFMVRQGYDDYLTDLWSRENENNK